MLRSSLNLIIMKKTITTLLFTIVFSQMPAELSASERRFSYIYEATTPAKGELEIENWATWKRTRQDDGDSNRFEFRHEIEYGLTDRTSLAVYVADWKVVDGQTFYKNTALELIQNLSNPVTDVIGSALYGEAKLGDQLFKLEGKLLLQKNFGPIVLAYNAGIEAEWEGAKLGQFKEESGEFMESFGISYQVTPKFFVGGEFLHEIQFGEWKTASVPVIYAGPNVSIRHDRYFVTTTTMMQVTQVKDEPDFQWRLIFGMHF